MRELSCPNVRLGQQTLLCLEVSFRYQSLRTFDLSNDQI